MILPVLVASPNADQYIQTTLEWNESDVYSLLSRLPYQHWPIWMQTCDTFEAKDPLPLTKPEIMMHTFNINNHYTKNIKSIGLFNYFLINSV